MKRVSGYVLVKETNMGIPNLIVTAYDSGLPTREIPERDFNGRTLSLGDLGRRIGSVLTDETGNFLIERADVEFQGDEARPDLVIIVFAPEDVQDLNTPFPLPQEERILYISTGPREDAGAEEAFVIRLLEEQLDHFQITSTLSTERRDSDDSRLATSIEDAWDVGDRLRRRLAPRLLQEQQKSEDLQAQAEEKVGNLSAIPRYLRDDDVSNHTLLINGRQDLANNLKPKQDQVVAKALESLHARNPVMRLSLTETELATLGLKRIDGKVVGHIDPHALRERMRANSSGSDLVRKRGMNNPRPEVLIRRYLIDPPAPQDAADILVKGEDSNGSR